MRITETVVHPADLQRTFDMLRDPRYQQLRCERSGATDETVTVEEEGDATVVTVRRHLPTTGLPDVARAFVGPQLLVVETVRWGPADADGEREGAMSIDMPGTPVHFLGGVHLRSAAEPGATEHVVDGDLEANIPLLGRKIEEAVAPQIREVVQLEAQVAREWLSTR
ncbi:DUF2505 domain-containing protein [Ornithinimicrobium tianjinense]|uniref:DUF2505 domain-containing protein n=1 Tax=Ornithinimicrobium tianjinense TaxID=1195761 RepID=A0A917BG69_9MICO|nr:DUF2505 domain-containing protein [Ornithinimicrobium tianjinense]GGF43183.1 hypothetical protein GCM10011366_08810 [Ornithinimicrobium tianjinense]